MANRLPLPRFRALDANGDPAAGAKLYFYQAGTTTPLDTFSDTALTSANANPVVADGNGLFGDIFLQAQDYGVILTDSADVTLWTADPVAGTVDTTGDYFNPAESSPQAMTIELGSGAIFDIVARTLTVVAAQTSALMVAPTTNPRNDIVYVDRLTGVDGTATGAEAASPSDPTIPDDKLPVARVRLTVGMTEITTADIDDIREIATLGYPGVKDEDDMASDSATHLATQQSIRAYVPKDGHIFGLTISNNGTDAANDLDIAAGDAFSDDGTTPLVLAAPVTRQADVAFGTGNGGLSSSLTFTAGVSYHIFLCKDSGGTVTVGFDSSTTAANLVTDHSVTVPRRIGSRKALAGPVWQTFYQDGDEVLVDWVQDDSTNNPGTSAVLITTSVPTGFKFKWLGSVSGIDASANATVYALVTSPDQTDAVPAAALHTTVLIFHNTTADHSHFAYTDPTRTNTSGQIRYRLSASDVAITIRVMTRGWIDRRGRDA